MSYFLLTAAAKPGRTTLHLLDVLMLAVCALGVIILARWFYLWRTGQIRHFSPVRRNRIPVYFPFLQIVVWILLLAAVMELNRNLFKGFPRWKEDLANYISIGLINSGLFLIFIRSAKEYFARGLRGIGLGKQNLLKDAKAAALSYLGVLPLVVLSLLAVDFFGKKLGGDAFNLQTNEGITVIQNTPHPAFKAIIFFVIVIIVPFFEEILFRGYVQSMIRSYTGKTFVSILLSAILFSVLHPSTHLPALFVLSCCLGYIYEFSGSLYRPVFLHMIFNGVSISFALIEGSL